MIRNHHGPFSTDRPTVPRRESRDLRLRRDTWQIFVRERIIRKEERYEHLHSMSRISSESDLPPLVIPFCEGKSGSRRGVLDGKSSGISITILRSGSAYPSARFFMRAMRSARVFGIASFTSSLVIQLMMTSESIDFRPSGSSMHSWERPVEYEWNGMG